MIERCEVCGGPVEYRCAGLDTPSLAFCAKHGKEHERDCPEIRNGFSMLHKIDTSIRRASATGGEARPHGIETNSG